MHALGLEFGSAAQLSKRPGSVWNCLWGNALKRSPGIIRKSRVSYPGPGFLSSATWPSLPKKHYNGFNQYTHVQPLGVLSGQLGVKRDLVDMQIYGNFSIKINKAIFYHVLDIKPSSIVSP